MNRIQHPPRTHSELDEANGILTVNLDAVVANWRDLAARAGKAHCGAVVKADAYGLGLDRVAGAIAGAGCETFFVALLSEGRRLRALLPKARILVLNGLTPGTADEFEQFRLEPVLGSMPEIEEWDSYCASRGQMLPAAVHVDTGLNRHGLSLIDAQNLSSRRAALRFTISLMMSHFACADDPTNAMSARQIDLFRTLLQSFPGVPASLANSAGLLGQPDSHFDLVRPGIALYGGRGILGEQALRPVVKLEVRIVQVRSSAKGETVGYGATRRLTRDSRIAVCSAGYADGVFRAVGASDDHPGAEAIVAGHRCPFVGRVSMDFFAVDVTDVPEHAVKRGDFVTVMGDEISVDDFASHANTIGYEALTSLGRRFARTYVGG